MDQPQLRALEYRCIQEEQPFCTAACPIHVDVRAFMAALAGNNLREARRVLDRTMPFPGIVGRLCDEPCRAACKRGEIGDPLAIASLERYCVSNSEAVLKLPKLPDKGGKVAVLGAGLSGMTAALDLARKGRPATLFTSQSDLGGPLRAYPETTLPREALQQASALLESYGVAIHYKTTLDAAAIQSLTGQYDAVYFDADDLSGVSLPFDGQVTDPVTLALTEAGCFKGGGRSPDGSFSVITQVADGRRAALSIERHLQKVSLTAQREKEGASATRMHTVTTGIKAAALISPADPGQGYTAAEAQAEAGRCIQCECMECVKQCAYLREYKEYPKTLVRKIYNNQAIVQGTRNANSMINACSLCGQCTVICPNDFPVAEVCRTTRMEMVQGNHMPPSAHDFALEEMRFSLSEICALSRHQPGTQSSRHLFYPGCQLSGSAPEAVKRAYSLLAGNLEGGVGLMLGCCGIPAHWAGQDELFAAAMRAFKEELNRLGNPVIITACSSCLAMFSQFAPEHDAVSLWTILDGLTLPIPQGSLPKEPLTIHDPCTARHQSAMRASVRSLCAKLGLAIEEHELNEELTDCCGYGGLMQFANQPLGAKAATVKAERSPRPGLAYCAMCRDNLAATGLPVAHLLDYLCGYPGQPDPLQRRNPGFSRRHENRARLKADLLATLWQEPGVAQPEYKQITLRLSETVLGLINSRHVLEEDIQKVIFQAEQNGRYLLNPDNNHRLACFKPVRVTYWVEYEPTAQGYLVHTSYSHRMLLPEARS